MTAALNRKSEKRLPLSPGERSLKSIGKAFYFLSFDAPFHLPVALGYRRSVFDFRAGATLRVFDPAARQDPACAHRTRVCST